MVDTVIRVDDRPRVRDRERTRRALLDAALAEFSEKGFAGARVSAIAARAGVNKQLISYYFGGKQGLRDALVAEWLEAEAEFARPELTLGELVGAYVRSSVEHRAISRVFVRESVEDAGDDEGGIGEEEVALLRRRQEAGELPADLDPAFVLLALQGAASAGLVFPGDVRRLTGLDPGSEAFAERYAEQLARLLAHLGRAT
jgi:AcrR family transcriptional regulator